jgi:hypothetical protein
MGSVLPLLPATAKLYDKIFASYSHKDTVLVRNCMNAIRAIGHDVLIDYDSIHGGELWDQKLERLINEADIFQLFWSENSSKSEHVKREWTYALAHCHGKGSGEAPGAGFIRPTCWKRPFPDPPRELAHLHFKYLPELAQFDRGRSYRIQTIVASWGSKLLRWTNALFRKR